MESFISDVDEDIVPTKSLIMALSYQGATVWGVSMRAFVISTGENERGCFLRRLGWPVAKFVDFLISLYSLNVERTARSFVSLHNTQRQESARFGTWNAALNSFFPRSDLAKIHADELFLCLFGVRKWDGLRVR